MWSSARRFEEFEDSFGIAANVLTNRLKLLRDEGVLERLPGETRPGRPRYVLTDKGRELAPALIVLMKRGDRHYPTPAGPPRPTRHTGCRGTIGAGFALRPMRPTCRRRRGRAPAGAGGAALRAGREVTRSV